MWNGKEIVEFPDELWPPESRREARHRRSPGGVVSVWQAECGCPMASPGGRPEDLAEIRVFHYEGCEHHDPKTCVVCNPAAREEEPDA